jgi:hypothetical protein
MAKKNMKRPSTSILVIFFLVPACGDGGSPSRADGTADDGNDLIAEDRSEADSEMMPDADVEDIGIIDDGGESDDAAVPDDGGDPVEDDGPAACVFAPRTAAIVVYYGSIKDADGTQRFDLTRKLANPGLDVVFTAGGGNIWDRGEPGAPGDPGTGAFKEYHDICVRLALHMSIAQVVACLARREDLNQDGDDVPDRCAPYEVAGGNGADDLAAFWEAKLDLGWDYISIDEIKVLALTVDGGGTRTVDFRNGEIDVERFASALEKLADLGYDKRVFPFFAPHSESGPSDQLPLYTELFTACRDHCRTVMHELYLTTTEVEAGRWRVFNNVATALHDLGVSNINRGTTAIIAVGNEGSGVTDPWFMLDDATCDISPWDGLACPALPGSGGINEQLDAMHRGSYARYWWGVGFYKLGAVRSKDGYWTKEDFVDSTAERVDWWATHTPP